MQKFGGNVKFDKYTLTTPNTVTKTVSGHSDIILDSNEIRADNIILTGTADSTFNLIFNPDTKKTYSVFNETGHTTKLKNSTGGTFINVANNNGVVILNDGTNIILVGGGEGGIVPNLANVAYTGAYADLVGTPNLATVATSGSYTDLTNVPQDLVHTGDLATVATTGAYTDLIGTPNLATVATSGSYTDLTNVPQDLVHTGDLATVATTGAYTDLTNVPQDLVHIGDLATVATTGAYTDLIGTPNLATVATSGSYTDLTNVPQDLVHTGDLATVATTGAYTDLTNVPQDLVHTGDLATVATTGVYADLVGTPNLATVATSGSYTDLTNVPQDLVHTGDLATVATTGAYTDLIGTPNLATVATSGSYTDLTNVPQDLVHTGDLATVATSGSYTDLTNVPQDLVHTGDLATVATSGNYNDLINAPSIIPANFAHVLNVSQTGSDTTGDGSLNKPYATITHALSQLPSPRNSSNRYAIQLGAGQYSEVSLTLPNWVAILGMGYWATRLTVASGFVTLDTSGTEFNSNGRISLFNLQLAGSTGINFDTSTKPDASQVIDLVGLWINGAVTVKGRSFGAEYLQVYRSYLFNTLTVTNTHGETDDVAIAGNVNHIINGLTPTDIMDFSHHATRFGGDLSVVSDNSRPDNLYLSSSNIAGNLSLEGNINLQADNISLPKNETSITLTNSAIVTKISSAYSVNYTPTTLVDWDTPPSDIKEALDHLASKIKISSTEFIMIDASVNTDIHLTENQMLADSIEVTGTHTDLIGLILPSGIVKTFTVFNNSSETIAVATNTGLAVFINVGKCTIVSSNGTDVRETLTSLPSFAPVAYTGSYDDLTDKPTSGSSILPTASKQCYVALGGSDTSGDGSINNPYASVGHTLTTITDASATNKYVVNIGPGVYSESYPLLLPPFIWLNGTGNSLNSTAEIRLPHHGGFSAMRLSPAWSTGDNAGGLANLKVFFTADLYSLGAVGTNTIDISNASGDLTFIASSSNDTMSIQNFHALDGLSVYGGIVSINECYLDAGLYIDTANGNDSFATLSNTTILGDITITANDNTPEVGTTVVAYTSRIDGIAHVNGIGVASFQADAISFPPENRLNLQPGGQLTRLTDTNGLLYTPTAASDWNSTAPTSLQEAIDRIAAALSALGHKA
jgi:hypothetical protein